MVFTELLLSWEKKQKYFFKYVEFRTFSKSVRVLHSYSQSVE